MMELKRNAEFVRGLGCKAFASTTPTIPALPVLPDNLKFNKPYIVIFPGASWVPKMWPSQKFAELVDRIADNHKIDIIFCGGGTEFELCQKIIDNSGHAALNLAGLTSLQELVEVIRGASLVVANDTSAIHIAAATQTNAVCLLGGGHFGRFLPYQVEAITQNKLPNIQIHRMDCYDCNWNCKYTHSSSETVPCVANITVNQVYLECDRLLAFLKIQ
jgi:ADP-heptose:LPS heptosyltransferase